MSICERQTGGRILCIRLSGLGDVVHTLNALTLLRRERPDAHIGWVVEDRFADLLRDHPYVDELFVVPRKDWGRMLHNPLRWPRLIKEGPALRRRLGEGNFDISVDFQSSLKSAWIVQAAGAPLRVGFASGISREMSHLVQNLEVDAPREGVHRIERDLALLAGLGIPTRYATPILGCSNENTRAMDEALEDRRGDGPLVIIHPGTSEWASFKRWIPARYSRVADRLAAEENADVLVSYGPNDRELAEEVVLLMKRPGSLAPRTANLQQLVSLLARADLFIGSDTGPMHLASALGVPVVALFGPKDPVQTGPFCSRSIVVTARVPCRPCTRRRCSHVRCMTGITSSQVLQAARRVLAGEGVRRADAGVAHRPSTRPFRLGRRTGRITARHSCPEFFTALCDLPATAGEVSDGLRERAIGPGDRTYLVRRWRGLCRRARRAWHSLVRLRRQDAPVAFPVCYMEALTGARRDQLLVLERPESGLSLPRRLSDQWWDASDRARAALIRAIASALCQFHRAAGYHGDLRPENVLVCAGEDGRAERVLFAVTGRVRRLRFCPAMIRTFMHGLDLGRLARGLKPWLVEEQLDGLCRAYCEACGPDIAYRTALEKAFRWRKEMDSWLKRFL